MTHARSTIIQALRSASEARGDRVALRFKRHKNWLALTWRDYYRSAEAAGLGLAALGVRRGDRVAIVANTRFEWAALDFGILGLGAVTVPVYQSLRAAEIEHILNDSGARVVVCEDGAQIAKWFEIAKRCPNVEAVVCIEPPSDLPADVLDWDDLLNCGLELYAQKPAYFEEQVALGGPADVATIVYTSGTTGQPKGVVLGHDQIMSEVEDLTRAFPISPADSTLTFLPYAHVLGRIELWLHTYVGFTLCFAESIERLRENLVETRPTVIIGVPRIFEKVHAGLLTQIDRNPWRKRAFEWLSGGESSAQRLLADRLIYRRLREGLGGHLRFVVSGGAPLDAGLAAFFHRAGILILEGYGLTETTGAIIVNTPRDFEFGTIGRPLSDVDVKLADDGEILLRSRKVFREYWNDPEATRAVLSDGYFATGDVGTYTERGFLKLTDRKKDLIKTAGGKFVAPQRLENLLKQNPLVSNVLIHGERRKYIVALITLNESALTALARERGWSYRDYRALTQLAAVEQLVRESVAKANAELASYESIKRFAILPEDFTLERGELTPSLKLKRRLLDERHRDRINELYES